MARLAGLTGGEFAERFERRNLLGRFPGKSGKGDAFPRATARAAAASLLRVMRGRKVVLLGGGVAAAFGVAPAPLLRWRGDLAVAPHPSGVSHWWNDEGNVARARRFWRRLGQ